LSFENEDLKTILETLATEFDLNVSFDEDGKKYTLRAEDVTVRELLKNLLLHRNYQYTLNENDLIVVSPAGREQKTAKEILFRDMSLMEALRIMAKMMNINIFVTPNVTDKTVNFYVDYLNLNELLDLLLETNGLKKIKRAPNTYIIDTI
ncbi:MAG: FecR domain-containing protein, partial [Candidatus Riflebacteria bacterium]